MLCFSFIALTLLCRCRERHPAKQQQTFKMQPTNLAHRKWTVKLLYNVLRLPLQDMVRPSVESST